eukprot:scaffold122179_cov27-Tisochrysis_lutea.AAC.8
MRSTLAMPSASTRHADADGIGELKSGRVDEHHATSLRHTPCAPEGDTNGCGPRAKLLVAQACLLRPVSFQPSVHAARAQLCGAPLERGHEAVTG